MRPPPTFTCTSAGPRAPAIRLIRRPVEVLTTIALREPGPGATTAIRPSGDTAMPPIRRRTLIVRTGLPRKASTTETVRDPAFETYARREPLTARSTGRLPTLTLRD